MGTANDSRYGPIRHDKLHDGEPVFVLRAADVFSAPALEGYAEMVGHIPGVRDRVLLQLDRFQAWQAEHGDVAREPD